MKLTDSLVKFSLFLMIAFSFRGWAQKPPTLNPPAGPINETLGCESKSATNHLTIESMVAERILLRKIPILMVPEPNFCYKKNQDIELRLFSNNRVIARARVGQILRTNYRDLKDHVKEEGLPLDMEEVDAYLRIYYGHKEIRETPLAGLFFKVTWQDPEYFDRDSRILPTRHPLATTVGFYEVKSLLLQQEPPVVVDLRKPNLYKEWHIPTAINTPFEFTHNPLNLRLRTLKEHASLASYYNPQKLPTDMTKPILIYSDHIRENTSWSIIYYLRYRGHKNIYWYRGGDADWHDRRLFETPTSPPKGARLADYNKVRDLMNQGAQLVDVRGAVAEKLGNVKGAQMTRYVQSQYYELQGEYKKLSTRDLYERGDRFLANKLPKNKSQPIVFYGADEGDWGAYNAVRWAASYEYKNLYWYRNGYLEWRSLARWFGEDKYPLENAPKTKTERKPINQ